MAVDINHSKVDLLKMKYQKTYSEDLFDVPHAPSHQCPEIDKLIKIINSIDKISSKAKRMDEDELISAMDDINGEIWGIEGELEKIRSACEGIREWGQGWKDMFKKVINNTDINGEDFM